MSDQQLLRDYAERRSDAAFGELVRRHLDAVYSAALRMTAEEQSARDTAQAVFVALANGAASLAGHPVLSGWLHCTARNLAAKNVRTEVRRRAREQEAAALNQLLTAESEPAWERIAPHLDAALGDLSAADRDAVTLRYFEKKSAPEMSDILGISEEAAQKRVARAVDRLREYFARNGVAVGVGGLVVVLSAQAVQAAPAGLAATISTAALAGTTIATSTTVVMTLLQKTLITVSLAAAVGAGIFEAKQAAQARAEAQTLQQQQAPLADQLQQLLRERNSATNRVAGLMEELAKGKQGNLELLKLRREVTRLQFQSPAAINPVQVTNDPEESGLGDVNNARGVALDDGKLLDFTNGVAVVRDPDFPDSATARDEYRIVRLLWSVGNRDYCEVSLNTGGTGTYASVGIFTKDDNNAVKSLHQLAVGDRVQIYNVDQGEDGKYNVYFLDHAADAGMASTPTVPKKTVFQLDPNTGKYVESATYIMATDQPWVKQAPAAE